MDGLTGLRALGYENKALERATSSLASLLCSTLIQSYGHTNHSALTPLACMDQLRQYVSTFPTLSIPWG